MEKMNDLRDLLTHEIEDLYSAEEQMLEALPMMIEKATNKNLKDSLKQHLKVTQEQKKRLDKIQKMMGEGGENSSRKTGFLAGLFGGSKHVCKGMKGIIDEGNKIMAEDMNPDVMDAAIIASAQKVEHYEICGYGTARSFASELNLEQVAKMLEQTLNEEYEADFLLTELAVNRINQEAEVAGSSGDSSASGRTNREGRGGTSERVVREQEEMQYASNRTSSSGTSGSEKKPASSKRGGEPKASGTAPRSSGTGRETASSKKAATASRNSKSSSKTDNARSSAGGRSTGSSTGRGRK
ncbi:MAG: ferritin-like domain-containing protein [Flavisolibacter sp.]